ncbi:MAG TPA: nuclear transport factor 2 family protein [Thermoleophilaceae bacterium]|nr:nuclear transport factor 2 family protein [Thermoleophilaceae bacterium]
MAAEPSEEVMELVRLLVERWNAGDTEGTVELYRPDAVIRSGPDWPEQSVWAGHQWVRRNIEDWRSVWESVEVEVDRVESHGDAVVCSGNWKPRGRVSGLGGDWPFAAVVRVVGGRIASVDWHTDVQMARAAAIEG